jgi:sensor histidine kinase YesM
MSPFTRDFIFSKRPRYRVARHVAFWLAWAVFFGLIYASKPNGPNGNVLLMIHSYTLSFIEAIIFMPNHVLFSYLIMYFLLPRYLLKGRYWAFVVGIIGAIVLTQTVAYFSTSLLIAWVRDWLHLPQPARNFYFALMAGLRGGMTVGGFATTIKLMKYWYQKQQDNQQLTQQNLTNELQLLKSQLHPHFLFNTLNNLYALTLRNSPQSPELVLKLSELLSYMLYGCNAPKVALAQELAMLHHYIALERMRYGDRLDVSVTISGDVEGKRIAPLLLLPFVENAFKHGTSEQLDQAWISLDLTVRDQALKFKLINGRNPDVPVRANAEGIGLQNVRKRLTLLYPGQYDLTLVSEEESFLVTLMLTLETIAPEKPALVARSQPVVVPASHLLA